MLTEESEHNPALVKESFVIVGSVLTLLLSASLTTLNPHFNHLDHQHRSDLHSTHDGGYGYMTDLMIYGWLRVIMLTEDREYNPPLAKENFVTVGSVLSLLLLSSLNSNSHHQSCRLAADLHQAPNVKSCHDLIRYSTIKFSD